MYFHVWLGKPISVLITELLAALSLWLQTPRPLAPWQHQSLCLSSVIALAVPRNSNPGLSRPGLRRRVHSRGQSE